MKGQQGGSRIWHQSSEGSSPWLLLIYWHLSTPRPSFLFSLACRPAHQCDLQHLHQQFWLSDRNHHGKAEDLSSLSLLRRAARLRTSLHPPSPSGKPQIPGQGKAEWVKQGRDQFTWSPSWWQMGRKGSAKKIEEEVCTRKVRADWGWDGTADLSGGFSTGSPSPCSPSSTHFFAAPNLAIWQPLAEARRKPLLKGRAHSWNGTPKTQHPTLLGSTLTPRPVLGWGC